MRKYTDEQKLKKKIYYEKNKEKILSQKKEYRENNKDAILTRRKTYLEKESVKSMKKEYSKKYRLDNRDSLSNKSKDYYLNNRDDFSKKNKEYNANSKSKISKNKSKYYLNNKESIQIKKSKYHEMKMEIDELYKLKFLIRNNIRSALKARGSKKNTKTEKILGCSFVEFKIWMEDQFTTDMSWDNHGTYWEIDHIYPISKSKNESHLIKLNHFSNLRPLPKEENRSKRDSIENIGEYYITKFEE